MIVVNGAGLIFFGGRAAGAQKNSLLSLRKLNVMKIILRILLLSFLLSTPVLVSCSRYQMDKRAEAQRRKEFEKEKQRRELEAQAAYEQAVERNYAMQTPETRKAMRDNMKKSNALREHKKPNFLQRWFTPKHQKRAPRRQQ